MDSAELMDGYVCRLAPITGRFPPDSTKPLPHNFALSNQERAYAKATNTEPRLSVWDEDRTTLDQAKAIYARECIGFSLNVADIRRVSVPGSDKKLRVVRDDSLPPDKTDWPGADGHCGIVGVHRPPGAPKAAFKNLRRTLCDLAVVRG
jgi:hypothetical protein